MLSFPGAGLAHVRVLPLCCHFNEHSFDSGWWCAAPATTSVSPWPEDQQIQLCVDLFKMTLSVH